MVHNLGHGPRCKDRERRGRAVMTAAEMRANSVRKRHAASVACLSWPFLTAASPVGRAAGARGDGQARAAVCPRPVRPRPPVGPSGGGEGTVPQRRRICGARRGSPTLGEAGKYQRTKAKAFSNQPDPSAARPFAKVRSRDSGPRSTRTAWPVVSLWPVDRAVRRHEERSRSRAASRPLSPAPPHERPSRAIVPTFDHLSQLPSLPSGSRWLDERVYPPRRFPRIRLSPRL